MLTAPSSPLSGGGVVRRRSVDETLFCEGHGAEMIRTGCPAEADVVAGGALMTDLHPGRRRGACQPAPMMARWAFRPNLEHMGARDAKLQKIKREATDGW
jgi:hypothetical protein